MKAAGNLHALHCFAMISPGLHGFWAHRTPCVWLGLYLDLVLAYIDLLVPASLQKADEPVAAVNTEMHTSSRKM